MGYRSIYWTLDSLDSVGAPKSVDFLVNRITGQSDAALDGEIILMHIGSPTSADALPLIIENLQGRGFKIVPVSEIIK
jgi:peptidoglycan/xylan/chitin deacetylase (PgdA/CDA1 family)